MGPSAWNFCEYMFSPADGTCNTGSDFEKYNMNQSPWLMQNLDNYSKQNNGVKVTEEREGGKEGQERERERERGGKRTKN
jgi:hypothetical protein